jgi:2-hydroxy-3-keto-5-methylthiopentenyl-1-phosphate phosphatase
MKKPIIAIIYDFDRTLALEDLQNFSFIPHLGMTPNEFWQATNINSQKTGMEKILSYMYMMMLESKKRNIPLTKEFLYSLGKSVKFFPGLTTWFERINQFGEQQGVTIEHYIITSGTKEIIEGTSIAKSFKAIFGCEFLFDEKTKEAIWPKIAINYTMKTQYFFRIAKGILNQSEDDKVNERVKEKRIRYRNIIYIGDGLTDVPAMVLAKENGGKSIGVYAKDDIRKANALVDDDRVNFICEADYTQHSMLDKVVKLTIQQMAITEALNNKEIHHS